MSKHYTSLISGYFGRFASRKFPSPIQYIVNHGYVKLMGLDMRPFEKPESYKTLNALFTRAFKEPKKITATKNELVSGVDALITDFGTITEGRAYQIKGMAYDLDSLFGSYHKDVAKKVEGGEFMNFYLSPKDYHRYHMPMNLKIHSITHIPGKLYPVNFPLLRNMKDLFIENERVVMECEDDKGRVQILVLVGALNVGKMVVTFEEGIQTNSEIREPRHYNYEALQLSKGELFGWFEMGSTILTFSEKGSIVSDVCINQKVSFGDVVGKIK